MASRRLLPRHHHPLRLAVQFLDHADTVNASNEQHRNTTSTLGYGQPLLPSALPQSDIVAQLELVSQRLHLAKSTIAKYEQQLTGLHYSTQAQSHQMHAIKQSLEEQLVQVNSLTNKTIDMGMQVGMHTNSIVFIETSIAGHTSHLTLFSPLLNNTKFKLLHAEVKSQDLHNNLKEQLQVQAGNLSAFTSMYAQFMQSMSGIVPISPHQPEPPTLQAPTTLALTNHPHTDLNIPKIEFPPDFFIDEFPATPRCPIHAPPLETPSPSSRPRPAKCICNIVSDNPVSLPPVQEQALLFDQATASIPASLNSDQQTTAVSHSPTSDTPPAPPMATTTTIVQHPTPTILPTPPFVANHRRR
ncbi:hypothetical protein ACA910_015204 [Epithemia clementina (nom. ined.)]